MEISYHGLTSAQARQILAEKGLNVLPEPRGRSLGRIFLQQFQSFLVALLLIASIVSFFLGDFLDGGLILGIVLLNALIGFSQQLKAKKEVEALKIMVVPTTRVLRDGRETTIESKLLVEGDVVVLVSGDKVPADGEILTAGSLTLDESSLTGESVPVVKEKGQEIFMGTTVLSGHVLMRVSQTGTAARFGQIARSLEAIEDEKTPLEIKLEQFGFRLGAFVFGVIILVALVGIGQGRDQGHLFFTGVALAVAAIPEGLPAVLTIALAVGVSRLAKRRAIVKRLVSAESLGSVEVICTDKTGTLTKNEMTMGGIYTVSGGEYRVSGVGYNSRGEIKNVTPHLKTQAELAEIIRAGILCNSSSLAVLEDGGNEFRVLGDTTEGALLILAKKAGVDFEELRKTNPISEEIPFDSARKMMTVVSGNVSYTKGAPEEIVPRSSNLSLDQKDWFMAKTKELAGQGQRILAVARRDWRGKVDREKLENSFQFLGIVAIVDPPREEVAGAIKMCQEAGIKVVMITGDSVETARAIAQQVGVIKAGEEVVSGSQLEEYTDDVLVRNLATVKVFARVNPLDKLRIVEAFQRIGLVTAVTGDGVNDAPALKRAQVGVAMGITGTDVAKETADLVITDDNFTTIVSAISEGRVIFANLIKAIRYLLAANLGEVLAVCLAILFGWPLLLSPLALLWINLVGDGLPALALAVDPRDGNSMGKKTFHGGQFLNRKDYLFILVVGLIQAILALGAFHFFSASGEESGRLAAFTAIIVLEAGVALLARGKKDLFSNRYLLGALLVTMGAQVVILLLPALRNIFA